MSPTVRSRQVGWLASSEELLDTLASARQLTQHVGGRFDVSYEVQQYRHKGAIHTLTEATLASERTCVQGAFEAGVSAVQVSTAAPEVRVSFAERVVGLVPWDDDERLERLVENPWGSRAIRDEDGIVCRVGPPACAADCSPGSRVN